MTAFCSSADFRPKVHIAIIRDFDRVILRYTVFFLLSSRIVVNGLAGLHIFFLGRV
jgi:hypothetical protein